jgi:2-methylcitrate dehydratase PrpD
VILSNSATVTAIEALAANVLGTQFENFDRLTIEAAKNRIIDVIGCAIGGANAPGNQALVEIVKDTGGKPEASILVWGGKVPAPNAALVNSILCRSFDYEVMNVLVEGKQYPSHHAATMVMTALALGEATGVRGREMITAMVVGDDITARIIAASGIDLGLGWDGTGTYTAFGATAIAGRMLGLNKLELRNAFGIVLNNIASSVQGIWDGATTFKYGQGTSALNGIMAAKLAQKGWKGVDDALNSRYGFYSLYTHGCENPEILTRDLGKKYYAEAVFKAYPSCRATHANIDAALAVATKYTINDDEIDEVTISGPSSIINSFVAKPFRIREFPHCDAIFSLRYTCATALLRKSVKQQDFTNQAISDIKVNKLISKIKLAELPATAGRGFEVKVKMKDGSELTEFAATGKGDPIDSPLSEAEIMAKYRSQVEFSKTVNEKSAEKLLNLLKTLEKIDNVRSLVDLAMKN